MLAFIPFLAQAISLDDIEKAVQAASKKNPPDAVALLKANQDISHLLEQSQLTTGDQFLRALKSFSILRMRFDRTKVRHELVLASLASGNLEARTLAKQTWDQFLISVSRPQRIGTMTFSKEPMFRVEAAPKSVVDVFKDPERSLARAKSAKDNDEVTKICDEDQKDREGDFSKFTAKQMNDMRAHDVVRLKRIVEILNQGKIVTISDFDHASLVLQHGSYWNDYCLAHELSICSLLLGNQKAAWLAAATYDRMLESGGFHQRFGTQYSNNGNDPFKLDPVDTEAIGDAERKAMHCPTLEEAKNRKWD